MVLYVVSSVKSAKIFLLGTPPETLGFSFQTCTMQVLHKACLEATWQVPAEQLTCL